MVLPIYASVEYANTYVQDYLNNDPGWLALDPNGPNSEGRWPERERKLVEATQYLDLVYGSVWKGCKTSETQPQDWPRSYVEYEGYCLDEDTIPTAIRNATVEVAVLLANGVELLKSSVSTVDSDIISESKSIDVLRKSVTYDNGKGVRASDFIAPRVQLLVRGLIRGGGSGYAGSGAY